MSTVETETETEEFTQEEAKIYGAFSDDALDEKTEDKDNQ